MAIVAWHFPAISLYCQFPETAMCSTADHQCCYNSSTQALISYFEAKNYI